MFISVFLTVPGFFKLIYVHHRFDSLSFSLFYVAKEKQTNPQKQKGHKFSATLNQSLKFLCVFPAEFTVTPTPDMLASITKRNPKSRLFRRVKLKEIPKTESDALGDRCASLSRRLPEVLLHLFPWSHLSNQSPLHQSHDSLLTCHSYSGGGNTKNMYDETQS